MAAEEGGPLPLSLHEIISLYVRRHLFALVDFVLLCIILGFALIVCNSIVLKICIYINYTLYYTDSFIFFSFSSGPMKYVKKGEKTM